MIKRNFNEDWVFYPVLKPDKRERVCLPHDAMLFEERKTESQGGVNSGWFMGNDYVYEKTFLLDDFFKGHEIYLEFEGVYHDAEVFINGKKAAHRAYGFTNFFVNATDFLDFDNENLIKVFAKNSDQPNCRWYSGAGIIRPVSMLVLPKQHILLNGIKVTTLDYIERKIKFEVRTNCAGSIKLEILKDSKLLFSQSFDSDGFCAFEHCFPFLELWDLDNPTLYECRVSFFDDVDLVRFGVREASCGTKDGFCLNGNRVILNGACVHSGCGLLGAAGHEFEERRKARILKESGFNAIRAAHNPASKAFLDECDRLGLLVMDEYTDMWFMHKTKFDYASDILNWWKQDLIDMVDKDYNHPSVVMYSIGNEVGESSKKEGIEFCRNMVSLLHELDSRPVTCGINPFFNYLFSLGLGVYSDKKAAKNKAVGSAFFNRLAGIFGDKIMKLGATLHGSDKKTKGIFNTLDITGYNYGILRYKKDLKKYPKRIIVGSETFCKDAVAFNKIAKINPRLIGDFVWAGMDYLGEVGIGAWETLDYVPSFNRSVGWISAGAGRIDLTGKPLAEMSYLRVAYGIEKIGLAVVPICKNKNKHSPSAWKMTNAIESWSFNGCEGALTWVEAYSCDYKAELFINDKLVGKKRISKIGRAYFKVKYESGVLRLKTFDRSGQLVAEKCLNTATEETVLNAFAESNEVKLQDELCYVRFLLTDSNNMIKPLERAKIDLKVKGGKLLAFGNGCSYNEMGYLTNSSQTYYGEALAIIKPERVGKLEITGTCEFGKKVIFIDVV